MSLWDKKFDDHAVWTYVAGAREAMNAIKLDETSPDAIDALGYSGLVLEHLEERRTHTEKFLVAPPMLNALASPVSNWATHLEQVAAGVESIQGATPFAESVVAALAEWPPLRPKNMYSGFEAAARLQEGKVKESLARLTRAFGELDSRLAAITSRADELQESVATQRQRISEAIADFTTESANAVDLWTAAADERKQGLIERWSESSADAQAKAADVLKKLRAHEEAAGKTLNAVTSKVVASDYGKYARNKTMSAWVYDVAAFVVGAAGVGALIIHLLTNGVAVDTNIGLQLMRIAVSGGALGLATLIGRRGAQQHREARAAKRTDLALSLLGPFIANLAESDQKKIVNEVTRRVFIDGNLDPAQTREGIAESVRRAVRRSDAGSTPDAT